MQPEAKYKIKYVTSDISLWASRAPQGGAGCARRLSRLENAGCQYVSDHGETPESHNRNQKMEECWEIPFLFYFNKAYKNEFPELVTKINEAKHIPFQTDIFFEIVCDLMGVTWEQFSYENIPYHPSFKPHEFVFPK